MAHPKAWVPALLAVDRRAAPVLGQEQREPVARTREIIVVGVHSEQDRVALHAVIEAVDEPLEEPQATDLVEQGSVTHHWSLWRSAAAPGPLRAIRACRLQCAAMADPLPALVLYSRPGCHLCEEARRTLELLLADRAARGLPAPAIDERDIEADESLHQRYALTIPVVALGGQELELATSPMKLRRLLESVLDDVPQVAR